MISKFDSIFPLNWMNSLLVSAVVALFSFQLAVRISPDNFLHPLWIVAIYSVLFGAIKAVTRDFAAIKNSDLLRSMVFGPLQILAGVCMVVSVTLSVSLLGLLLCLPVCFVFGYFGARNVARATYILQCQAFEQTQLRRVEARRIEFAAQDARSALERLERAEEAQKIEDALLADLAECLSDSGSSDTSK